MPSPTLLPQIHTELTEVAGSDHVQVTTDSIFVEPLNTNSIAQVIHLAKLRGLSIGIVGGGTKQQWLQGNTPNIQLSLRRLDRVLEHAYQDLTCTVQAGCTWVTLQKTLAQHGQFIALDPLFPGQATVGGILATNDSGSLRHRYGSLRDLVIGMTLVLADGTIAKSGGKVVKNVAGYDLCKLMTGSYGTLAIITEATFRLHPLPQHHRTFTVATENAVRLAGLTADLRASHLLIQSLQIRRDPTHCFLDIRLNAHPEAHQDSILERIVHSHGLILLEASDELWTARGSLYNAKPPMFRIATLPADVCGYIDSLQKQFPSLEIRSVSQAIGLHDVAMHGTSDDVTSAINVLREPSATSQATITVLERSGVTIKQAIEIPEPVMALMRSVKHQFDPTNMLNPGRFFPGA